MLSIANEGDMLIFHCVCFVCDTNMCFTNSLYVCKFNVCVRIHGPAYADRVPVAMQDKFFYIKPKVWNKSHIV